MPIRETTTVINLSRVDQRTYLTVKEAAAWLHVREGVIRNYLFLGHLTTYKFKTLTLLSRAEVAVWPGKRKP